MIHSYFQLSSSEKSTSFFYFVVLRQYDSESHDIWVPLITQDTLVNGSLYDGILVRHPAQEISRQSEIV